MGVLQRLDSALDFDQVSIPLTVVASFLGWFSLYCVLCLTNSKRSYEWHCRMVTAVHAVIISAGSYVFGMYYNPWFITNPGGRNNNLEILTLVVCLGYFLFDICWCVWFHEGAFMIAHHTLTIACIVASLVMGVSGTEVGAAIFGSEASNPMLQMRYFLRETGQTKNLFYEVNDLVFMGTFVFCRMGIGTYALYNYLQHPEPQALFRAGSVGLYIVSLIFMYSIARFAWRKYTRMYREWMTNGRLWAVEDSHKAGVKVNQGNHQLNGHANQHEHVE